MACLVDDAGRLRSGDVGIFRGEQLVHMAPPAKRIPQLIDNLLEWVKRTGEHPLVASCVFHYEFEFIHPFADGNGRMGRLWQTLILCQWKPLLAYLPVETVVRERQHDYYSVLGQADEDADATPFVEFMLQAVFDAIQEAAGTVQVTVQVAAQVARTLEALAGGELGTKALMAALGLKHRSTFRTNYLNPALAGGWIERTQPDAPHSPTQRYRLTSKGRGWLRRRQQDAHSQ